MHWPIYVPDSALVTTSFWSLLRSGLYFVLASLLALFPLCGLLALNKLVPSPFVARRVFVRKVHVDLKARLR
jgi:hypothetical protein